MQPLLVGHLAGRVIARSPDPPTIYLSNPDWIIDDQGPLLLWDRFGGEHAIELARPDGDRWRRVATFAGAMHSHLVDLPERGLKLVLGVLQDTRPRSIALWWSDDGETWRGPVELFGGADYHAGSTPWTIHDGRLHVPFEIQQTKRWGSYAFGSIHADLNLDPRRPGSWRLSLSRVPWSVFPGAEPAGALEGNLVVAPDGQLYNLLRPPVHSRLGRAVWDGSGWRWQGLVQGVCNQSKPEIFTAPGSGRWFLLANGWPARKTSSIEHGFRNTLCLWESDEPDLSRWKLLRVIASDLEPRHAYSYAAAVVDGDGTLWTADRHGDDETWSYHDTNCIAVRRCERFLDWVGAPALVPYGHDTLEADGTWQMANPQDGLLLSHLDGALYPLTLHATVRVDRLPSEIGALDLLGFATCDLVLIAGLQLVHEGQGALLAVSTAGQRVRLPMTPRVGGVLRLEVRLPSPRLVEVVVDGQSTGPLPTHCVADPSLAGVIPRADRPKADLGRVAYLLPPSLTAGDTAAEAPPLGAPWILADGRGASHALPDGIPAPAENLAPGGPLVSGGHARYFDPWAGGLVSGAGSAALWSPLEGVPEAFTLGGFLRQKVADGPCGLVLAALGERSASCELRRDLPYLALLLTRAAAGAPLQLALASWDGGDKQMVVSKAPVAEWIAYALTAAPSAEGNLDVRLHLGALGEPAVEVLQQTVSPACCARARHWLALVGGQGGELWSTGGQYALAEALPPDALAELGRVGFAVKMDRQPARRPTCAVDAPPELAAAAPEPPAPAEPPAEPTEPPAPTTPAPPPEPVKEIPSEEIEAELEALKRAAEGRPKVEVSDAVLAEWEAELAKPAAAPEPQPAPDDAPEEPPAAPGTEL